MSLLQHSESVQSLCLTLKTPTVNDPRLEGAETQVGSSELSLQRQAVSGYFGTEPFSFIGSNISATGLMGGGTESFVLGLFL